MFVHVRVHVRVRGIPPGLPAHLVALLASQSVLADVALLSQTHTNKLILGTLRHFFCKGGVV